MENIAPWIMERMEELEAEPSEATQPERFDKEVLMSAMQKVDQQTMLFSFC